MPHILAQSALTDAANILARPPWLMGITTMLLAIAVAAYRHWTRPVFACILFALAASAFSLSLQNDQFHSMAFRPDNVAILLMLASTFFFLWLGFRRAAINDHNRERNLPLLESHKDDKVLVWPDLVYVELICLVLVTAGLIAWSILIPAPLEQPANPGYAPNPAKAPWYFVGLQELLVYFDPWLAGVVYPTLIIVGLCAIPFIDNRPSTASGSYSLTNRRTTVFIFLFGLLVLWILPIVVGTFLRGPNWSYFGPFEPHDPLKHDALNNTDLSAVVWTRIMNRPTPSSWFIREWPGLVALALWFIVLPIILGRTLLRQRRATMGGFAYRLILFLLLMMALLPVKMVLRWAFGLRYILFLPEWNANV